MLSRNLFFSAVASLLGLAPMVGAMAGTECQATKTESLVAPLTVFTVSPLASLAETTEVAAVPMTEPFRFQLRSPVVQTDDTSYWQMPAGRYWFSLEVREARVTQEGIGLADEDLESWLLAPADSLAVPF